VESYPAAVGDICNFPGIVVVDLDDEAPEPVRAPERGSEAVRQSERRLTRSPNVNHLGKRCGVFEPSELLAWCFFILVFGGVHGEVMDMLRRCDDRFVPDDGQSAVQNVTADELP